MAKVGEKTKIWHPELSNIHENAEIGNGCTVHSHVWIGEGVKIGNNVRIQAFSFIPTGVIIEDEAFIGPRVTFTNDKYPPADKGDWKTTTVKRGASLGASVTVLPGITIGENARIGAGSNVTKDIPAGVVACGNPARIKAGISQKKETSPPQFLAIIKTHGSDWSKMCDTREEAEAQIIEWKNKLKFSYPEFEFESHIYEAYENGFRPSS